MYTPYLVLIIMFPNNITHTSHTAAQYNTPVKKLKTKKLEKQVEIRRKTRKSGVIMLKVFIVQKRTHFLNKKSSLDQLSCFLLLGSCTVWYYYYRPS